MLCPGKKSSVENDRVLALYTDESPVVCPWRSRPSIEVVTVGTLINPHLLISVVMLIVWGFTCCHFEAFLPANYVTLRLHCIPANRNEKLNDGGRRIEIIESGFWSTNTYSIVRHMMVLEENWCLKKDCCAIDLIGIFCIWTDDSLCFITQV